MINWMKRALGMTAHRDVYIWEEETGRDSAKRELDAMRRARQLEIQAELGIDESDGMQAWLRLHELLKEYNDRLKALEDRQ